MLKAARERAGMSQSDLARTAGISPNMISRLEAGERQAPTFATVAKLASALGVSLDAVAAATGTAGRALDHDPPAIAELHALRRTIATADQQVEHLLSRAAKPLRSSPAKRRH